MRGGAEWIVDASGCDPGRLTGEAGVRALSALFDALVAELDLHPVEPPVWHRFPDPGGVTGLVALSESHLACHSFPEEGTLALNLYTCRPRRAPDWERLLHAHTGAREVRVQRVERAPGALATAAAPERSA